MYSTDELKKQGLFDLLMSKNGGKKRLSHVLILAIVFPYVIDGFERRFC